MEPPASLGTELTGNLRCARCGYNLRGLSVRSVCPECATPIPATLLAVIDPQAAELQPIRIPAITAGGMVVWIGGALAAALAGWLVRACEAFPALGPVRWAPWTMAGGIVAVGIGGIVMISPHNGIRRLHRLAVVGGIASCFALAAVTWWILAIIDGPLGRPYLSGTEWSVRWLWTVAATVLMGTVVLGFRPVFFILQSRSHLLRTGRVERQTLRALLASAGMMLAGDLIQAGVRAAMPTASVELATNAAMCLTGVGSLLFTAGLVGVAVDVKRLLPVIIAPPLGLKDVLSVPSSSATAEPRT